MIDRKHAPSNINVGEEKHNDCSARVSLGEIRPRVDQFMDVLHGSKRTIAPNDFGTSTSRAEAWKVAKQAEARARYELNKKRRK